jgi:predicted aspartyl protease
MGSGCQRNVEQRVAAPDIQGLEVPLLVLDGPGGARLAFVPVSIDGQGPFAFALDTGASQSVIDKELADQLGLPKVGQAVELTGVAATTEAEETRIGSWRAGDVQMPVDTVVAVRLNAVSRQVKMRGLLGSDVLSRFGAVTVDYEHRRLLFRSRP